MAVLSLSSWLLLASPALATGIAGWWGMAATQVQSTVFLTGGILSWGNWTNDSATFLNPQMDKDTFTGVLYEINLNHSINVAQQDASEFVLNSAEPMSTEGYPGYAFGGIFNNYYTWFTLGGLALLSDNKQRVSTITRGDEFSQGAGNFQATVQPNQPNNSPGFSEFITSGSFVSQPDQGAGWWFGGLVSQNNSAPIQYSPVANSNKVSQTSRIFIGASLPMDGKDEISFTYLGVPTWLAGRAESSLTWVPYGKKGALVLIGGVDLPSDILSEASGNAVNNTYMTELAIYDIDGQVWYNQSTQEKSEQPPQMASFCSVVVPTSDGHGQEIFVYGGYDGTGVNANPYDDVWVLSLPAFQWTKVYDGSKTLTHARSGSYCIAPNPSTMITIGGAGTGDAYLTAEYGVDIFDFNSLSWTGIYDASSSAKLVVPDAVVKQIGGSYSASGPGNNAQMSGVAGNVATLFSTAYQQKVQTYFPYSTIQPSNGTNNTNTTPSQPTVHKSHTLAIALGVAIPVVVIAALILGFCCLKKRRSNKEGAQRTQQSRGNVFSWLGKSSANDPAPEKSHTSEQTAVDGTEYTHDKQPPMSQVFEAPGSNPSTPGWGTYASGHGSPQVLSGSMATSPFMGSAEVDAQSRYEIMDHAPRDGQSLRQHHMYPRSLSGDQVMSMRSDSISHASTSVMPSRHYGYVSPYELPQDRSREDLAVPPADVNLGAPQTEANPNASSHSLGLGAEHVLSPVALLPVAPVSRKPLHSATTEDDRPRHQRNQSSMSSDLPNLPSPGPEEDRRRSRLIDTLPDPKSGQVSPVQPQTAKRSIYKEDLDS